MSWSREGEALLQVEISEDSNTKAREVEILARLHALRSSLPKGVQIEANRENPEAFRQQQGFMVLQLVAPLPPAVLRNLAQNRLAPRFLVFPGIANVEIEGGEQRELRVTLSPDWSQIHGASLSALRQDLVNSLRDRGYGKLADGGRQVLLQRRAHRELPPLAALSLVGPRNVTLHLADLGHIDFGAAPVNTLSRIDGNPVITLTLDRTPGSHLLRTAKEVRRTVGEIQEELPPGVQLLVADDRSEDIRKQLLDLGLRGGLGLALVFLTLITMLRSSRAIGISLFIVLVSLSASFLLFKPLGLSLNVLTLAGLTLLFGLVIDNAIVILERLQGELASQRCDSGAAYAAAAVRAVRAVWLPLLGGTLTTCVVFLPMVYLSGELRGLFAPFAVLCSLTLGFSLLASILLIPDLGQGLHGRAPHKTTAPHRALFLYGLTARFPRLSLLLLVLALGLPMPLLPDYIEEPAEGWQSEEDRRFAERYNTTFGSELFHKVRIWLDPLLGGVTRPFLSRVELGNSWEFDERPEIHVWLQLPPGSGIDRADERIRVFEQEARTSPAVQRTLVNVRERVAVLRVLFYDEAKDTNEPYLLRERLISHAVQMAGMEVSISGLVPTGFYGGMGEVSGFTVYAFGPSYERLEELSRNFVGRLERRPRVAEVDINAANDRQPPAREVIRVRWGADAAARTGLAARELAEVLRPRLWRETPDFYADLEGDPRTPMRIVMEGVEDLDFETLLGTPLAAGHGGPVRLADHATVSLEKDPPVIERIDQQYRRTLRIYFQGPYRMGKEMLDQEITKTELPPGYRLEQPKTEFFTEEVQRQFFWLVLATVALVFLVIAAVLESWRLAALVMLSIPVAWIGVAIGFLITGQNFAEGDFIGILLTVGVSVNHSILLADAYRRLRYLRPNSPVPRLALLALRQRLRPMWTTTLTSIASMLPLLVFPDAGNFWVGLAVTVVGGLLSSTLLAPAATIAVLSWASRRHRATQSPRELVPAE